MSHQITDRRYPLDRYPGEWEDGQDHNTEEFLPGATVDGGDGLRYFAVREARDHGRFALVTADSWDDDGRTAYAPPSDRQSGILYQPLAEGTTAADISGATYAWDDGTAWHFAHESPGERHDLAAQVEALAVAHCQPAINGAQLKVLEATNNAVRSRKLMELTALQDFAGIVQAEAAKAIGGRTLGHHGRDPHRDHVRQIIVAAIAAALAAWERRARTDTAARARTSGLRLIAAELTKRLTASPTIETRAARAAREAAEAKAKAAAEAETATEGEAAGAGDGS